MNDIVAKVRKALKQMKDPAYLKTCESSHPHEIHPDYAAALCDEVERLVQECERLQEREMELMGKMNNNGDIALELASQRDAALAEVERLRKEIAYHDPPWEEINGHNMCFFCGCDDNGEENTRHKDNCLWANVMELQNG